MWCFCTLVLGCQVLWVLPCSIPELLTENLTFVTENAPLVKQLLGLDLGSFVLSSAQQFPGSLSRVFTFGLACWLPVSLWGFLLLLCDRIKDTCAGNNSTGLSAVLRSWPEVIFVCYNSSMMLGRSFRNLRPAPESLSGLCSFPALVTRHSLTNARSRRIDPFAHKPNISAGITRWKCNSDDTYWLCILSCLSECYNM